MNPLTRDELEAINASLESENDSLRRKLANLDRENADLGVIVAKACAFVALLEDYNAGSAQVKKISVHQARSELSESVFRHRQDLAERLRKNAISNRKDK